MRTASIKTAWGGSHPPSCDRIAPQWRVGPALREVDALLAAPLVDQRGDQSGPPGLMRSAQTEAVITVEVFVEGDVVAPVRIVLAYVAVSVHRAFARGVALED